MEILAQLRPHQWIYNLVMTFLAWSVLKYFFLQELVLNGVPDSREFFSLLLVILLFMSLNIPSQLFLQDAFSLLRKNALLSTENVYFFQQSEKKVKLSLVLALLFHVLVIGLLILVKNSWTVIVLFYFMTISALSYAGSKHSNSFILASVFRFLSGFHLFLFYLAFLLDNSDIFVVKVLEHADSSSILILIIVTGMATMIGLMDAAVNLAGDVRDFDDDLLNGIRTFPIAFGIEKTEQVMLVLELVAIGIFVAVMSNAVFSFSGLMAIIAIILLMSISFISCRFFVFGPWRGPWEKQYHGLFHLSKVLIYVIIGLLLQNFSLFIIVLMLVSVTIIWTVTYALYLLGKYSEFT